MTRQRDDPFESLQREVERLFHDVVYQRHPASHFSEPAWQPPADLVVSPHGARVLLELAGVPRENVRVTLHGRSLEVSGRRNPPQEKLEANYHRAEIYFGEFRRSIELPWEADENSIEAHYRNGLLEIHLKAAGAPLATDIPVRRREPR